METVAINKGMTEFPASYVQNYFLDPFIDTLRNKERKQNYNDISGALIVIYPKNDFIVIIGWNSILTYSII